jgi:hypothetical protein
MDFLLALGYFIGLVCYWRLALINKTPVLINKTPIVINRKTIFLAARYRGCHVNSQYYGCLVNLANAF